MCYNTVCGTRGMTGFEVFGTFLSSTDFTVKISDQNCNAMALSVNMTGVEKTVLFFF